MQVAMGKVVDGKVVLDELWLPEGTLVTVFANEADPAIRLAADAEAELLEALDDADRHEGISAEEMFERLRKYD